MEQQQLTPEQMETRDKMLRSMTTRPEIIGELAKRLTEAIVDGPEEATP
jgi:hypothetical protein